ncbi:MAG: epoxyqueuosine reductase QueH [Planctomycetota bacterium]|nr:epoxyqueuosine reductase QueH [Planctomycetota bacterium]
MTNSPPLLLHVCCAPCLATARASAAGHGPDAFAANVGIFFYNPNIHPLMEFRRREKALRVYLERYPLPAEIVSEYGLQTFLERMLSQGKPPASRRDRCAECYRLRLGKTAETARFRGFAAFSTTLLASREQDRDLLAEIGRETAAKSGLAFIDADWRKILPDAATLRGIYKQPYCGCLFSEEERYRDSGKHLYKGSKPLQPPGNTR